MFTLQPFIIYQPHTQSFLINDTLLTPQRRTKFISYIEVKHSSMPISNCDIFQPQTITNHCIYLSQPIKQQQSYDTRIIYLPPLTNTSPSSSNLLNPTSQKLQEFLSSLLLMLTNVCVYDLSSKYLRNNVEVGDRCSYLAMVGNCRELSKVEISSNMPTKIQITQKIRYNQNLEEFALNQKILISFRNEEFGKILRQCKILENQSFVNNFISFEEYKIRLFIELKLERFMNDNEEFQQQYRQLKGHNHKNNNTKQMLTINQLQKIINHLSNFSFMQELTKLIQPYNNSSKFKITQQKLTKLVQQIITKKSKELSHQNTALFPQLLKNMKNQHFSQIQSLSQMYLKKQILKNMFQQYGIDQFYFPTLTNQAELKLQCSEIKKLSCIIYEKQSKIKEINQILEEESKQRSKIEEMYELMSDKIESFNCLNGKYMRVCEQYEKEKYKNTENKIRIDTLQIQKQSFEQNQCLLRNIIERTKQQKQKIQSQYEILQTNTKNLKSKIFSMEQTLKQKDKKLQNFHELQCKSYQSLERAQIAQQKCSKNKQLTNTFINKFQLFKNEEIKKFNYILQRNHTRFQEMKKDKMKLEENVKKLEKQVKSLNGKVQEDKIHMKYYHNEMMKMLNERKEQVGFRQVLNDCL